MTLNIASKIFANREIEIKQVYRNITSENFRSEIQQVNFANGAEAAGIINRWVESQTNHKVKKIFNSSKILINLRAKFPYVYTNQEINKIYSTFLQMTLALPLILFCPAHYISEESGKRASQTPTTPAFMLTPELKRQCK